MTQTQNASSTVVCLSKTRLQRKMHKTHPFCIRAAAERKNASPLSSTHSLAQRGLAGSQGELVVGGRRARRAQERELAGRTGTTSHHGLEMCEACALWRGREALAPSLEPSLEPMHAGESTRGTMKGSSGPPPAMEMRCCFSSGRRGGMRTGEEAHGTSAVSSAARSSFASGCGSPRRAR